MPILALTVDTEVPPCEVKKSILWEEYGDDHILLTRTPELTPLAIFPPPSLIPNVIEPAFDDECGVTALCAINCTVPIAPSTLPEDLTAPLTCKALTPSSVVVPTNVRAVDDMLPVTASPVDDNCVIVVVPNPEYKLPEFSIRNPRAADASVPCKIRAGNADLMASPVMADKSDAVELPLYRLPLAVSVVKAPVEGVVAPIGVELIEPPVVTGAVLT